MTARQCIVCRAEKESSEFRGKARGIVHVVCLECEKTVLRCSKCKEVKPRDAYAPAKKGSTGRTSYCRECGSNHQKISRKTEGFRARRREKRKRPEIRAKESAAYKAWAGAPEKAVAEKTCSNCGVTKSACMFSPHKKTSDRLASWCKACVATKTKSHRKNPEVKARESAYAKQPERLEKMREYNRSPQGKANSRKYWTSAKGKVSRAKRAARRRAAQEALEQTLTAAEWELILLLHGNACAYCHRAFGRDVKVTIDHKQPVARGGGTTKENIVPACTHCNSSKGARDWPKTMPDGTLAPQENA